ncbi:MAG: sigma-54-dependent Fis family transcriptional regulator [Syntrophomonas sp.]
MESMNKRSDIGAAWAKFIANGNPESLNVRPEILESWCRCYSCRVDPYDGTSHRLLEQPELEKLLHQHRELIEVARPFMVKLYEFVAGSGFIVFLADERGYMMEVMGDYNILENAYKVNLSKGYGWMEEEVGTNGIGTALALGRPCQVSGQEHYCRKIHSWTCSAAPILDEDGRMLGALQMSGPSHEAHLHTLGMVVAAVEAISDQMRIKKQNRKLTVLNNSLNGIFQTMSDGAVLINHEGIISQINPVAERILGKGLSGDNIQEVFGRSDKIASVLAKSRAFNDVELIADTALGRLHCLATGKPIKDNEGGSNGAVVFFNPIHKVKNLANRFSGAEATFYFRDIIGDSRSLCDAIQLASQAASTISNVLITGESGTGKELFAQAIHNQGPRRDGPFVALNCAALPRELIASELFGYVEGAFTGASRGGRPGKFELAAGGTLFLDEIGDMPIDQQATLLRVLQEKKITRVGGDKIIPVDVRIICATHKNLLEEVRKGNFREDLYYRLNVILVSVPPLRERQGDVIVLFEYLLEKISRRLGISIEYVDPAVGQCLQGYSWPGNVRELENVVEKMVNRANGPNLYVEHLPPEIIMAEYNQALSNQPVAARNDALGSRKEAITDLLAERQAIIDALARHRGNISRVAQEMGHSRNTVYRKMSFYQISREQSFK